MSGITYTDLQAPAQPMVVVNGKLVPLSNECFHVLAVNAMALAVGVTQTTTPNASSELCVA